MSSQPVKVFDRHPSLPANMQVLTYDTTEDMKWCLLGGIVAGANNSIDGNMQLYSAEKKVSQPLTGHAAAFITIKVPDRSDPAEVLVFHQKSPGVAEQKLYVMEVGRDPSLGPAFKLAPTTIPVPQDALSDFPVSLAVDSQSSIAFLITKMGYLYMFDVVTGSALYRARISQDTIFMTCPTSTGAVLGMTARKGQLLSLGMNKDTIVPYIVQTLRDTR